MGGQKVEKRIGKAKLSNGFGDVTDANTALEKEDLPSEVDSDQNRPSIQAPWEGKRKEEGKTGSAKNRHKKIDINDLQKDMGNTKSIYQLYFISVFVFSVKDVEVFEAEHLPDFAKTYILPRKMERKSTYKEEEDVYRLLLLLLLLLLML